MALTDEEKQTLATLAEKITDEDGNVLPNFVPIATLKGRLADMGRTKDAAVAEANARLSDLQRTLEEREGRLREIEDSGKSQAEKVAEELVRERQHKDAAMKALQLEKDRAAQLDQRARQRELDYRLQGLLSSAHNPRHALLAARADLPGLGIEEDGQGGYKLRLDADGLPVDDPEQAVKAWWEKQPHLRAKGGTELPLSGRGARVEPPAKDPTEGMTEAQAMAYLTRRYVST